jgi:hypothetical protein
MAFASVKAADFTFVDGETAIGQFASSETGRRLFCSRCGTPLLMRGNEGATTLDFSLATLDEPDRIAPGFHIFYASHIAWAPAADGLPRHDRGRSEGPAS